MFLKFKKLKVLKKVYSKFKRTKNKSVDDTTEVNAELSLKKTFYLHLIAIIIFYKYIKVRIYSGPPLIKSILNPSFKVITAFFQEA